MDVGQYLSLDGLGLAEHVTRNEVSAAEVLDVARSIADSMNPSINAICLRLDERAERQVESGVSGVFAGVPFLLKDFLQDLEGVPTSAGSSALLHRPARRTSTVVQRWLDDGLVIFGKTTTSELASKAVTETKLFGPTRNPWNLQRTPGGSSGGAAAAVAAGITPVAAATDAAGSIRIPAACTGLVGLTPGRGLVPFGLVYSEPRAGVAMNGVMTRSVRDSAAMFDVMSGLEAVRPYAPAIPEWTMLADLDRAPQRLRIGVTTKSTLAPNPHPEAIRAVEHAAELLTALGHDVEEVDPPYDDAQIARDLLANWFVRIAAMTEQINHETGCGDSVFELDTRVMAALGRTIGGAALDEIDARRWHHVSRLATFHETHDVLVTPTLGQPPLPIGALDLARPLQVVAEVALRTRTTRVLRAAGVIDRIMERTLGWVPYTQLANITGRPAITLPLHWTRDGLPMGVQFVGPPQSERSLLRLARQLELAAPWFDRRPGADVSMPPDRHADAVRNRSR